MSGNLTGDFAALAKLAKTLDKLGDKTMPAMSLKGAVVLNRLVEEQFALGVDPWGRSWADLKESTTKKGRTPPPLTASGKMRSKAQAIPGVKGITEKIPSPAGFHQTGTKKMESRPLVPHGNVLPPRWSEPLEAAGVEVISSQLKIK
jgi:hypothetical protein